MLRNLKILLGQTVSAAGIQMDQTTCQRAFADSFDYEPAGNITYVTQWRLVITSQHYGVQ